MTTTDVLRDARLDPDGLDERSERFRKELRERADLTREQLAALAADLGEEMGERAGVARDALMERYHELEDDLPIEKVVHRARLGAWQALRAGLSGLMVLPGLLVRGLGALSSVADDLVERGADASERGRELAAVVPPSKAERRRTRARTAGVAGLGFLAGLVTGWILANREQTVVTYEPTMPASWEPPPRATTRDVGAAAAGSSVTTPDVGAAAAGPDSGAADVHIDVTDSSAPESGRDT